MEQQPEIPPPPTAYAEDGGLSDSISFLSLDPPIYQKPHCGKGNKKKTGPSTQEQAQRLSNATNMATAAAKSILMSGGTVDTAMLTARAAAESVLLPNTAGGGGMGGPVSSNSYKRQAKQQAQIVASMALVTAQSSGHHGGMHTQDVAVVGGGSPPLVIHPHSMGSRREELSSVGFGSLAEESIRKKIVIQSRPNPRPASFSEIYQNPITTVKRPPQVLPSPKILPTPQNESDTDGKVNADIIIKENYNNGHSQDSPKNSTEYNKSKSNDTKGRPSSYEDDEHSVSVSLSAEPSISMDSLDDDDFHDMDKTRNSLLSIGQMFADGMLCGPTDCSIYDSRRQHEDTDDQNVQLHKSPPPSSKSLNDSKPKEESRKDTKQGSKKPPNRKPTAQKKPDGEEKNSAPKSDKDMTVKTTRSENCASTSSSKSKKDKKREIEESMEKVVLRALATGETSSVRDIIPQSSLDGSNKSVITHSSKKSKSSKVKRVTSWMRERVQKKK